MKTKIDLKKIAPHIVAVIFFIVLPAIYFSPLFEGKALQQYDLMQWKGTAKEQSDFCEKTGKKSLWCSSMFSGMPGYLIYEKVPASIIYPIAKILHFGDFNPVGRSFGIVFLYLISVYIALILLIRCNPWLSLFGSLAFGFALYNIIIIDVGHVTKAMAMAMIIPIIAGIMLCFKKKYIAGGLLFLFSFALQLAYNHVQITYYTLIAVIPIGIVYFIYALKDKQLKPFFIGFSILLAGVSIGVLLNAGKLLPIQEYTKYTMRGGSELTITPNDTENKTNILSAAGTEKASSGLEINYAFKWSYGRGETFTLLVPGLYGGGSSEIMGKDSEYYKRTRQQRAPLYWGDQPFTSGPVYFGAIVCFLFILGLFIVKGPERWWIIIGTIILIMMSWGRNLIGFNQFLFEYLPMYNKFRTPSMSLTVVNALMVVMAVFALKSVFDKTLSKRQLNTALYWSAGITGGICLIFILFKNSLFSFIGAGDLEYQRTLEPAQYNAYLDILTADRQALVTADSFRSLVFIILSAGLIWIFVNDKFKKQYVTLGMLCLLSTIDLWGVDKRYLNKDSFVKKQNTEPQPTQNDLLVKQYARQFNDKVYRVYNLSRDPFNEAFTSAFNHSIGGYSPAKLRRYQDLIDFYLYKGNMDVLNMLNTRYFIVHDGQGKDVIQRNPDALGNAWFVNSYTLVENPNEEILALRDFNPSETAVINEQFKNQLTGYTNGYDSTAYIQLLTDGLYNPDKLVYQSKTSRNQLAVFSEVYYEPDWKVFVDGKPAEYFRVNYILRGMIVPAGEHTIEFKIVPKIFNRASTISFITSIALIFLLGGIVYYYNRGKSDKNKKLLKTD